MGKTYTYQRISAILQGSSLVPGDSANCPRVRPELRSDMSDGIPCHTPASCREAASAP